ncbi:hypothetical protein [Mycobacterium sp. 1245111.1]|uniref:hypothetical protein n=1 Tax=Mycobacterium sp. 1245111.1 TaxID=1834073 RepID=UPI000A8A1C67|nr:hypothetical protein [Mycobacterium sp. 1245111.1]
MNTPTLVALTIIAAIAVTGTLAGFLVHKTGNTAGIREVGRAIAPLLTAIAKAFSDLD